VESKIKVLHIIKSLGRGGAETLLPTTLYKHDKESFEFHYIYFLPWKDQLAKSIELGGGIVNCFQANNNVVLITKFWKVRSYVRKNRISLIHAHLPWAGLVAKIAGRLTGVPVLYTEHNKQERYHFLTRFLNLRTMNMLTTLITVSNDVAESARKYKKNLRIPIRSILNGVDTDFFNVQLVDRYAIRRELKIPENAVVIGTVAVFRFQKRLDLWMDVASKISQHH
jgi:glycosyltransferase involved in cell wall biosynthesis